MTTARLVAIGLIYICVTLAWGVLGGSLIARTGEYDSRLEREVALLWGGHHVQVAPDAWVERPGITTEQVKETDAPGAVVTREGRIIPLTTKELAVLEILMGADGAVVSAEELLEHVWDANADPFSNIVSVTLTRLRRKLGPPPLIETVIGRGYRM